MPYICEKDFLQFYGDWQMFGEWDNIKSTIPSRRSMNTFLFSIH